MNLTNLLKRRHTRRSTKAGDDDGSTSTSPSATGSAHMAMPHQPISEPCAGPKLSELSPDVAFMMLEQMSVLSPGDMVTALRQAAIDDEQHAIKEISLDGSTSSHHERCTEAPSKHRLLWRKTKRSKAHAAK